jgi:hypothetical protein
VAGPLDGSTAIPDFREQLVVELTFTTVVGEFTVTDDTTAPDLFSHAMETIGGFGKNGVYRLPDGVGGSVTITVEGL